MNRFLMDTKYIKRCHSTPAVISEMQSMIMVFHFKPIRLGKKKVVISSTDKIWTKTRATHSWWGHILMYFLEGNLES